MPLPFEWFDYSSKFLLGGDLLITRDNEVRSRVNSKWHLIERFNKKSNLFGMDEFIAASDTKSTIIKFWDSRKLKKVGVIEIPKEEFYGFYVLQPSDEQVEMRYLQLSELPLPEVLIREVVNFCVK